MSPLPGEGPAQVRLDLGADRGASLAVVEREGAALGVVDLRPRRRGDQRTHGGIGGVQELGIARPAARYTAQLQKESGS